ncbi:hypothetical protein [Corynebacterium mastitidis]|uniref:hypothetical protein n=1 Tax=Corynebacterium mastitidis TaxID=161890 RepID=UPI00254A8CB8|nr:hypothetical protein [Corynebacterium mastitidis]MDK8449964.1 hypothetical protein [Corynebacterium mastitidis]
MFGYTPEYIDKELDYIRDGPITRTKQRTYIIAVWSGWGGGHNYFLGKYARGIARSVLLLLTLDAIFRLHSVWLTALYIAIIMALTFLSIFFVAKSNPDAKPYNTKTGPFLCLVGVLYLEYILGLELLESANQGANQKLIIQELPSPHRRILLRYTRL